MSTLDPILAALDLVNAAEHAHFKACSDLDESDDDAMRRCNAACDHATNARRDLLQIRPTTLGGLRALAAHYSRWSEAGSEAGFVHIARSLEGCESKRPFNPLADEKSLLLSTHGCVNRFGDFPALRGGTS